MQRINPLAWAAVCALSAAAGCSSTTDGEQTSLTSGGSNSGSGGSATGTGGVGGGTGATGSTPGTGDLVGSAACKHVDLIISVDGSMSMTEELQAMRSVIFPAFAQRLGTISQGLEDFRVGTIDACPMPSNLHTRGEQMECNFSSGQPWIDSSSPRMVEEFACVGDILLSDQQCTGNNDDEQPASAAAAALESNPTFHRDDALTVVVAITDEDEQPTSGDRSPEGVYNRLVETVNDDPRRMVFLGIGGSRNCQGEYGSAEEASRLHAITDLFDTHGRGVFWDLCQGRLEDGLEEAFQVIEGACNDLCALDNSCGGQVPPGVDPNDPCLLDDSCGGGATIDPPPPSFCDQFPDDPSCILG